MSLSPPAPGVITAGSVDIHTVIQRPARSTAIEGKESAPVSEFALLLRTWGALQLAPLSLEME